MESDEDHVGSLGTEKNELEIRILGSATFGKQKSLKENSAQL